MAGLPSWFQYQRRRRDRYPAVPFWGSFGASHCCTQASPQGPIRLLPEAMMTWSTAVWSWRHCRPVDYRTPVLPAASASRGSASSTGQTPSRHDTRRRHDEPSWQYLLHVQHQQDLSIAQQGRPGIAAGVGQQPLHRLEHHIEAVRGSRRSRSAAILPAASMTTKSLGAAGIPAFARAVSSVRPTKRSARCARATRNHHCS